MKKLLQRIKCRFGWHTIEGKLANVPTDTEKPITLGWHECNHCGYSKIVFVFSNWKGTTP